MKVAFVFATALILCVGLLGSVQARFEKPKYCVGQNGKHYLRGEHYDDKVKGTCIRYTCVRKGKKLKMARKKVPCAVEPEPSLKANVTALEAKLEALQNSVESILVIMTALQSTSSQLEINMTSNMAAININKEDITTNKEGISVHDDAISSNTDVISSNQAGISVNKDSCSAVQITADKLKTCLGDVTSKECPISQNGKVAVIDAIIENEDDIEALESLHDNKGCCTPTTISTTTTPATTTSAGVVGDWSSWSDCSATCGNATKTRTRSCQISPCQPFVKEETVTCHLPQCNVTGPIEKCFYEDTKITFHDLGLNRHNQNQKPDWILSDKGRTLNSLLNTRPSAGLTNLGEPSDPVSFSGRVFSTNGDDDVMGMVFGYWNETNFFVVASSREFGPTNWYVGRLHATCGQSCASEKTISDAIWSPQDHPEDITVLATGSTYWQHNEKYNFTICFNPSKLLLNVNVTLEDGVDPILQTGTISAKTNDSEVDDISRKGGFIGVYVDSQADSTWDNLDCHECGLDEFVPKACPVGWTSLSTGCYLFNEASGGDYEEAKAVCRDKGGFLAEINGQEEQDTLWQFCQDNEIDKNIAWWVGASDKFKEGEWKWERTGEIFFNAGQTVTYDAFFTGEPNNVGNGEDCLVADSDGRQFQWVDIPCDTKVWKWRKVKALCEYSQTTGKSCKEIKNANPWSGDGTYFIHPDGQSNPVKVYCEMTTDGGGWTVMAYLRSKDQWDYKLFENNGEVGDIINGFSSGATLKSLNANYTEKLIVYLALEEKGVMLGRQWMMNQRPDTVLFPEINTRYGWSYRDSFGYRKEDAIDVCSHGCDEFRGFGMFGYYGGSPDSGWCGTQGGDYGCRDGNNICWMPRNMTLGCNVGNKRCSLLSGDGEGVIYAVR